MKYIHYFTLVLLILSSTSIPLHAEDRLSVVAWGAMVKNYTRILEQQNKSVYEITDLKTKGGRNDASFIIFLQAVKAGGLDIEVEFIQAPNPHRAKTIVKEGKAVALFTALWSSDFDDNVYISSTVIPRGVLYKGLYGLQDNEKLMNVKTRDDLKDLTCISSENWVVDWITLKQLELKDLHSVPNWEMMFKMVSSRGFDFAVLDFPKNPTDLSITKFGATLHPVPGIKISLDDSRHFMISKKHPDGERLYNALEKGLKILNENGIVTKLFKDVKVYREDLDDWSVISVK